MDGMFRSGRGEGHMARTVANVLVRVDDMVEPFHIGG